MNILEVVSSEVVGITGLGWRIGFTVSVNITVLRRLWTLIMPFREPVRSQDFCEEKPPFQEAEKSTLILIAVSSFIYYAF